MKQPTGFSSAASFSKRPAGPPPLCVRGTQPSSYGGGGGRGFVSGGDPTCPTTASPLSSAASSQGYIPSIHSAFPPPSAMAPTFSSPGSMQVNFSCFQPSMTAPATGPLTSRDGYRENARQVSLHQLIRQLSSQGGIDAWNIIRHHVASVHATGQRSKVLDLGCGTGMFAVSLGREEE